MYLTVSITEQGWHPGAWRPAKPSLKVFAEVAGVAERAGFDAILLGLPHSSSPGGRFYLDPLPLLAALIASTKRIGLAAFWPTDTAEPFHVARVMATLDHLSGGRAGWIAGSRHESTARFHEFVDVVRQLWDSWEDVGFVVDQASGTFVNPEKVHPIQHEGAFFNVRGPLNVPRPVQGQPVILLPDPNDPAVRRAAAIYADVVLAARADVLDARALRAEWADAARQAGRNPRDIRLLLSVMPILGATPEQAAARAELLDARADADIGWQAQRFVGTPAGLAAMMAAWIESEACDGFNILPATMTQDLRLVATEVVPLLQERGLRDVPAATATFRSRLNLVRPPSRFAA